MPPRLIVSQLGYSANSSRHVRIKGNYEKNEFRCETLCPEKTGQAMQATQTMGGLMEDLPQLKSNSANRL
jgi:hypothetical protein